MIFNDSQTNTRYVQKHLKYRDNAKVFEFLT